MDISFAGGVDIGLRRQENQDSIHLPDQTGREGPWLFVLADGMGGQQGGQVASELAVRTVPKAFSAGLKHLEPDEALIDALLWANLAIFEKSRTDTRLAGMGTTTVAALLLETEVLLATVGDSRCYLFRGGRLKQISLDHSIVAEQVQKGTLTDD